MAAFGEDEGSGSDNTDDDTNDIFSDDSGNDTDGTGDSDESDESDEEFWEEDKLPPPEHYEAEEANLDTKHLRRRRLKQQTINGIDRARDHWHQYCKYMKRDVFVAYRALSIQSLKGFLSWACDQRRGKGGRRRPGIQAVSSLITFWKQYSQAYKQDTSNDIDPLIMSQSQDVIELIADEKKLNRDPRPPGTMYVDDLAEYNRVLLTTNEMEFQVGWARIQLILYTQLAGVTANRPDALTQLRYCDLVLTLVRDPHSSTPRLCVGLTALFTKTHLGMKDANTFWLPEIIYDPTLVLSPHVFLLGMLFHIQAFKSPSIRTAEQLYSLGILDGLNQQELPMRDDLLDKFVFCMVVREGDGVRIAHERRLTTSSLRNRMRKGGEITGFDQAAKPYILRDGAAKAYNESPDISDSLQNLMLQHASIDTFVKHYLDRNITADVLSIYRGLEPQKALMRMVCSMSRSIDPRRPWKLTPEQSRSVNDLPHILKISRKVEYLKKRRDSAASCLHGKIGQRYRRKAEADDRWEKKYRRLAKEYERWDQRHHEAVRRLRGAKQHARTLLKREILERYRQEQPVIDSEQQLSGKVVDEHVRSELQRYMPPELMIMIDAVLTLPPTTSAAELQRRIRAIHAVSAYCGVEEGPICRRRGRGSSPKPTTAKPTAHKAEAIGQPSSDRLLESAAQAVRTEDRPKICFICLQNTNLVLSDRVYSFRRPGDLTKHFQGRHLDKFRPLDCNMCNVRLATLKELLVHAETAHGTVTRSPKYRMLAQSGEPSAPTGCLPPSSQPSWSPRGSRCEETDHQGGSSMCAWKAPLVSQIICNSSHPHLPFRFPFAFN
ncbi:hypothetical protein AJ78_03709 [Emergomyces pasteurianus Ep9510]|uniref:C2H2-type domain-containing protein n=1 Tax=Emergomyces pasteurianus Ep9510 TaxID=1447872 RepID=A0A1J9PI57_9EURO|nr:hypothetical protein AJ78_03709 [Emergomyces pasteurianus Ep9510]